MDPRSDAELITEYRQGDERAFTLLVERYLLSVYRFLFHLSRSAAIADDLTQETFVKVWRHLSRFQTTKSFQTWVFSIARNTAIDFFRKKQPIVFSQLEDEEREYFENTIQDERPLPTEILDRQVDAEELQNALQTISPPAKAVVLMHDLEDMTFQAIADATNESMNTVKSRYRRALLRLREYFNAKSDTSRTK